MADQLTTFFLINKPPLGELSFLFIYSRVILKHNMNNHQGNNRNFSYSEFMIARSPKSNYEALTALEKKSHPKCLKKRKYIMSYFDLQ
ncbi:hypothetical protein NMY3_00232 [Candidatus Nitrosocosmicus oleophilus]|uniref:Uncharacterized protein n=1 Tax=Candidatus Nitrosocosmicus oleophilus TaxID=1353260 RepID=A0A654LVG2_9ARCH|nr:hypothetical protein NMY3_00232 [Candidatus Nitrosocosmicus oleophilus]